MRYSFVVLSMLLGCPPPIWDKEDTGDTGTLVLQEIPCVMETDPDHASGYSHDGYANAPAEFDPHPRVSEAYTGPEPHGTWEDVSRTIVYNASTRQYTFTALDPVPVCRFYLHIFTP